MAAKKVYAVKNGHKTGIFTDWASCKEAVDGFPGAEYKGFPTMSEARAYLGLAADSGEVADTVIADTVIAYVDGSYEHSIRKYAFGCVFLLPDGSIYAENGSGNNPESAKLRNVTGEMLGAMFAVQWAAKNGFSKLELRYDYEGVEKWVTGAWKSKTELTRKYAEAMRRWSSQVNLTFTKVVAHTNVYYNEMADRLAKQALEEKDGVPQIRRREEMEPWKGQD